MRENEGAGQWSSSVIRFSVPQRTELVAVGLLKLSMRNEWHLCDISLAGPFKARTKVKFIGCQVFVNS